MSQKKRSSGKTKSGNEATGSSGPAAGIGGPGAAFTPGAIGSVGSSGQMDQFLQQALTKLQMLDTRLNAIRGDVSVLAQQMNPGTNTPREQGNQVPMNQQVPTGFAPSMGTSQGPQVQGWSNTHPTTSPYAPGHIASLLARSAAPQQGFPGQQQVQAQQSFATQGQVPTLTTQSGWSEQAGQFGQVHTGLSRKQLSELPPVTRTPAVDVVDEGESYAIEVDLPGVNKKNVEILCDDQVLHLTAEQTLDESDGAIVVAERPPTVYKRSVKLPAPIQSGECKAKLSDGILRITVPKREPKQGMRQVEISGN